MQKSFSKFSHVLICIYFDGPFSLQGQGAVNSRQQLVPLLRSFARTTLLRCRLIPASSIIMTAASDTESQDRRDETLLSYSQQLPTETTPLVQHINSSLPDTIAEPAEIQDAWLLARSAAPMVFSGFLQHSIGLAAVFQVGHLGQQPLAAGMVSSSTRAINTLLTSRPKVSLSIMTANVTGYAVYQGMATALDTLCAQAFGSNKKSHVGLHLQQMVLLLWLLTIPIGLLWFKSDRILGFLVPDQATAELAGTYLRIMLFGCPGYAAFEAGKRFLQAQGIYHASTYVLVFVAPLNAVVGWFLVWRMELGFIGAPIAGALTHNLLPLGLFLYVWLVDGSQCWNGLTLQAFEGWGVVFKLALPGFLMVESEYLAFEVLTLAASHLSSTQLAAQSIISPLIALTFQGPFALAIAASTTVAMLIGGGFPQRARSFAKLSAGGSFVIGLFNFLFMAFMGVKAARFLTDQEDVIVEVAKVLPVVATFQHFDSLATTLNGILRGIGKQEIGGNISIVCYYVVAIPISFAAAFWWKWELVGLWFGVAVALTL